jgi:hypothetical protein
LGEASDAPDHHCRSNNFRTGNARLPLHAVGGEKLELWARIAIKHHYVLDSDQENGDETMEDRLS